MKTASLRNTPATPVPLGLQGQPGFVKQFFPKLRMMAQVVRNQTDTFAAVGLAEGGDVEGAAELVERRANKKF